MRVCVFRNIYLYSIGPPLVSLRGMTANKLIVYVASPFGFCDVTREWHREILLPRLAGLGVEIIDPWEKVIDATSSEMYEASKTMPHEVAMAIGKINSDSLNRCDAVFAILDGSNVDDGTAAEIGFAAAKNKIVIGYRGDCRFATEVLSCKVNLQVEAFIERSGGRVYDNLDVALLHVAALVAVKQCAHKTVEDALAELRRTDTQRVRLK